MQEIFTYTSSQRGYIDHGWLKTFHTFSFGDYHNNKMKEFRNLRVMNEDVVAGGTGFGLHPHRNMEIITYIISGTLTHTDNLGNKEEITEGNFQIISAGTGILHSEFNHHKTNCHLLQIWIKPNALGGNPYHETLKINHHEKWALIANNNGHAPFHIKQNAELYAIDSGTLQTIAIPQVKQEFMWIQVAQGKIKIHNTILNQGDAIALEIKEITKLHQETIEFLEESKVLLFGLE